MVPLLLATAYALPPYSLSIAPLLLAPPFYYYSIALLVLPLPPYCNSMLPLLLDTSIPLAHYRGLLLRRSSLLPLYGAATCSHLLCSSR